MNRKIVSALVFALLFSARVFSEEFIVHGDMPKSRPVMIDDFEDGNYWIFASDDWDDYGDHKISSGAELSKQWRVNGKYSLKCSFDQALAGQPNNGVWYTEGEYDFGDFRYIAIDIYNPNDFPLVFGMCFQTESWKWLQAANWFNVPHGYHTLVYNVSKIDKADLAKIGRFMLMKGDGVAPQESFFYIDNVRGYN